jgi:hypothetical protein
MAGIQRDDVFMHQDDDMMLWRKDAERLAACRRPNLYSGFEKQLTEKHSGGTVVTGTFACLVTGWLENQGIGQA